MNAIYLSQKINVGGQDITGPLDPKIQNLGDLVNIVTQNLLMPAGAIILLIVLIWGGYDYMMSHGEPEKLKGAKAKITTGIIGFILLFVSFIIVKILVFVFGLQNSPV